MKSKPLKKKKKKMIQTINILIFRNDIPSNDEKI